MISLAGVLCVIVLTVNVVFSINESLMSFALRFIDFSFIDAMILSKKFSFISFISILFLIDNASLFFLNIPTLCLLILTNTLKEGKKVFYVLIGTILIIFFLMLFLNVKNLRIIELFNLLLYPILIFFNFIVTKNSKLIKILSLIPIINVLLIPYHTVRFHNNKSIWKYINITIIIVLMDVFIICIPSYLYVSYYIGNKNALIHGNITSPIYIDKNLIYVVEENFEEQKSSILSINEYAKYYKIKSFNIFFEHIMYNSKKREIYVYDSSNNKFCVFDKNLILKKFVKINVNSKYLNCGRIFYDNITNTIAFALEFDKFVMLDMDTLEVIKQIDIPYRNEGLIFNEFTKSYILTFWGPVPYILSIPVDDKVKYREISTPMWQGTAAISRKNKELYVSYHQRGRIYVYDAVTYKLKRKIKTQYSVRNITYDERYNILIAVGFYTGFVEIFLMDGSDRLIYRKFIGYHLRNSLLDWNNKRLYIPSFFGLNLIDINLLIRGLTQDENNIRN